MDPARLRLYLVADLDMVGGELAPVVAAAIAGGASCVQLRAKGHPDRVIERLGWAVGEVCRAAGALYVINDRVDVALAVGADGVHLGVDDLSIEAARRMGGAGFVVGYSPETDEQATAAAARGADYLGVGPVFGTRSKQDAGPAIEVQGFKRRAACSSLPAIGIGGITALNAGDVIRAGGVGVAVMSAILRAEGPARASEQLRLAVESALSS